MFLDFFFESKTKFLNTHLSRTFEHCAVRDENEYLKMSYLVTCIKSVVLIMVLNALCNASKSWTLLNALME